MDHNAEAPETAIVRKAGLLKRAWGVIATILALAYTAIVSPPAAAAALFGEGHAVTPFMRLWSWLILRTCGVRVEIAGLENLEGLDSFVLVSNHQSMFDILATIDSIPREVRFVAKRELKRIPFIGFILGRSGNIVIDRDSGGRAIRRAVEAARAGYSICVFAEGHRFSDNRVHEFNDGAAWLAIATRRPCVAMAISGTLALMPRGAKFVIPGGHIRIALGQPIETSGMRSADRAKLTRRLEAEVRAAFRPDV
jgi:1-acyl-sn-glycerol-3-phosphate acyltransferase